MQNSENISKYGLLRVASVVPDVSIADPSANADHLISAITRAAGQDASVIVTPGLSLTGYTCGDLFHQETLLRAAEQALGDVAVRTKTFNAIIVVGLPVQLGSAVFNCAAVIVRGKILGLVPKTYIPGYKEFYEERWFASARDLTVRDTTIAGQDVPVGTDILFPIPSLKGATFAVEICEDLWAPLPPSTASTLAGATIVANLSASNEIIGKAEYRRQLVVQQSARAICGYVYASSGVHESTTDVVFGGHSLIAENGSLLAESKRFEQDGSIIFADLDMEHLALERRRTTSYKEAIHHLPKRSWRSISADITRPQTPSTLRRIDPHPFVPSNEAERDKRSREILTTQATGLAQRLRAIGSTRMIIGLSGGLDSTLALLVAVRAAHLAGLPLKNIDCLTMPGFATSGRTKSNAWALATSLGVSIEEIDITKGVTQHLRDLRHDGTTQDITYENAQARYRTMLLMDRSNQKGGIVVGTGDLSEIALGWCTFNGDHISHYGVNASVPKTLVRYVVSWSASQPEFSDASDVLNDVLDTPVSPELVKAEGDEVSQKTEDIIGPYELHDFFLFHAIRWSSSPTKILWLARQAFSEKYANTVIKKWLDVFLRRFFSNQFKRSVMPDGPKVGSVALSPRGDWRMPSDATAQAWLTELDNLS